jgi:hypothetical protein
MVKHGTPTITQDEKDNPSCDIFPNSQTRRPRYQTTNPYNHQPTSYGDSGDDKVDVP